MREIAKMIYVVGWLLLPIGLGLAVLLGTQFTLVPADVSITGRVYEEAIMHPFRWYYGGILFIFMTISGLVLVGIATIIQSIENQSDDIDKRISKAE